MMSEQKVNHYLQAYHQVEDQTERVDFVGELVKKRDNLTRELETISTVLKKIEDYENQKKIQDNKSRIKIITTTHRRTTSSGGKVVSDEAEKKIEYIGITEEKVDPNLSFLTHTPSTEEVNLLDMMLLEKESLVEKTPRFKREGDRSNPSTPGSVEKTDEIFTEENSLGEKVAISPIEKTEGVKEQLEQKPLERDLFEDFLGVEDAQPGNVESSLEELLSSNESTPSSKKTSPVKIPSDVLLKNDDSLVTSPIIEAPIIEETLFAIQKDKKIDNDKVTLDSFRDSFETKGEFSLDTFLTPKKEEKKENKTLEELLKPKNLGDILLSKPLKKTTETLDSFDEIIGFKKEHGKEGKKKMELLTFFDQ